MGKRTVSVANLLFGALLLAASTAAASEFDRAMEPILGEYLKIQTALAADQTEGIESSARAIASLARELDPATADAEHIEHYKNIPVDLLAACEKVTGSQDIGSIREAFVELSKPLAMWVTMAKPKDTAVMYCPMKKAGWVQHGSEVANPYFGSEMLRCGEKVGGAD